MYWIKLPSGGFINLAAFHSVKEFGGEVLMIGGGDGEHATVVRVSKSDDKAAVLNAMQDLLDVE